MNNLRIVFMGTPDFAVATLKTLVDHNYTVVGVITAPDKPAGRGRKIQQSAVKKYALEQGLNVLQPTNLKDESFLSNLKALNANLQIVVAFRMLPKAVWQMPKHGTFNLHASLLPNYRGAAPINWAIINGDTKTGNTTFFIDEKIDTGAIIMQEETSIGADDTAGMLHDKLMIQGAQLVLKTVQTIEQDQVSTTVQPEIKNLKTAYKIHKDTCKINWEAPLQAIHNHIRGLSPYPGAWCIIEQDDSSNTIKIYKTNMMPQDHSYTTGQILVKSNRVFVAVQNGLLELLELQLPGKKRMEVKALLNGFSFSETAKMS